MDKLPVTVAEHTANPGHPDERIWMSLKSVLGDVIDGINYRYDSNMNLYSHIIVDDPTDDTMNRHSFMFILGKNGGTKKFEKEVLRPLADFMTCLRESNAKYIHMTDIELDNLDDIYYAVIICNAPKSLP